MSNKQCAYLKEDGSGCGAFAVDGSEFCFSHDPRSREQKALAVRKGGETTREEWRLDPVKIKGAGDAKKLLSLVIDEVRAGEIPSRAAQCIGYLAGVFLRASELTDLEVRMARIEKALKIAEEK